MTTAESSTDRRCRGRPQLRSDDETCQIIYEAARHEFAGNGFAATSMETVARRAGVSTKTLYRLIPNKAALFEGVPLPSRSQIKARARACATLFLRGCQVRAIRKR